MYILAFICFTINAIHAFHIFVLIVELMLCLQLVREVVVTVVALAGPAVVFLCVFYPHSPALGAALCSRLHTVIRLGSTLDEGGSSSVFVCLLLLCGGESALTF